MFTQEIALRIERSRRMKISIRIETRFRFMYRQSYFSGDFKSYTLKYVDKTSHFANNLYFDHNERRFHSEFHSRVNFEIDCFHGLRTRIYEYVPPPQLSSLLRH